MTVKKVNKPRKKMIASVNCKGDTCNMHEKVLVEAVTDCSRALEMRREEDKSCSYGCLGYGSCKEACPFDAIDIVDGLAVIIKEKCKGCRICVKTCPIDIIDMIPEDQEVVVDCSSHDFGKGVKDVCKVGCIGCQICVRACPFFAMDFTDKLAHINYDNCTNCKICAEKCPTNAITAELEPRGKADISNKCIGCTVCAQICPVGAIDGNREETHKVDIDVCISCTVCAKVCPVDAIEMKDEEKLSKERNEKTHSYEKEIIRYFTSFDEIKNFGDKIDFSEDHNSENYHGSLFLNKVNRVKNSDNFEVIYNGIIDNSKK